MKTDIHPKYFASAKVKCSCGNTFTVGSTQESIEVEICSKCHPFFTGEKKVIDSAGRVEKFQARATKKATTKKNKASKKEEKQKAKKSRSALADRGSSISLAKSGAKAKK